MPALSSEGSEGRNSGAAEVARVDWSLEEDSSGTGSATL